MSYCTLTWAVALLIIHPMFRPGPLVEHIHDRQGHARVVEIAAAVAAAGFPIEDALAVVVGDTHDDLVDGRKPLGLAGRGFRERAGGLAEISPGVAIACLNDRRMG